jgi:hypothetical protein
MGHSDIRLTMDVYASLFEEDRDDHGSRLSDAAEEAFSKKCSHFASKQARNVEPPRRRN